MGFCNLNFASFLFSFNKAFFSSLQHHESCTTLILLTFLPQKYLNNFNSESKKKNAHYKIISQFNILFFFNHF